jgi:hypothetical protein
MVTWFSIRVISCIDLVLSLYVAETLHGIIDLFQLVSRLKIQRTIAQL